MWNLSNKLDAKFFIKIFLTVFLSFLCLNLLKNILFPHVMLYFTDLSSIFHLIFKNIKVILITIISLLVVFYVIQSLYKKLIFLFSEETTVIDIFNNSEISWKKGEYNKVYDNFNYLYQSFQKDKIVNEYSISTESILLFQKSNLNNEDLDKNNVQELTNKLLDSCLKIDHYLNIIHLAYAAAHLSKFEEDKKQKAAFHLISSILFYYADPILHRKEFEFERRIYHYYVKHFSNLRIQILENELNVLMTGANRSSDHFKNELIPYMKQLIKENAVA